ITDFQSSVGVLRATTDGEGVVQWDERGEACRLDESSGFPSNFCKSLASSGSSLLVTSEKGVSWLGFQGNCPEIFNHISEMEGLPSNVVHDVLIHEDLIYLATSRGVVIVDSTLFDQTSLPPTVLINSIAIADSAISVSDQLELQHDYSVLHINLHAISYDPADRIEYGFRLNEDEAWVISSNPNIQLTRLEPGDYQLQVKAKKKSSEWCVPISKPFTIKPPFYKTWWFRTLLILVILGISFWMLRFITRRKFEKRLYAMEKEQAVLRERDRISRDMHDDLGSELTNIVILSRIAQSADRGSGEPVKKIDSAATKVIAKMNEIIWALNASNDSLNSLVDYAQSYFKKFQEMHDISGMFEVKGDLKNLELKAEFRRNVFLVIKEALQNAQ
ncbi:MAG: hypothetical protein HKN32_00020, partial [Flavobacteriales bacterium]|nr:hypothetical protein [Flavobacteriales bacterium]